jgi:hypothetical protein
MLPRSSTSRRSNQNTNRKAIQDSMLHRVLSGIRGLPESACFSKSSSEKKNLAACCC